MVAMIARHRSVVAMTDSHPETHVDVAVVGGGAAGLAAALQLVRSRRRVVVIDGGEPRNAPAAHMHSYLGHDGRPPGEFLQIARGEVAGYGGEIVDGRVESIAASDGAFELHLADGTAVRARKVVAATGLIDELPDIAGLRDHWGDTVIHCPYCHGWEVRDEPVALVATGPLAGHVALLFRQLTERLTVVEHVADSIGADDRRRLTARGVAIVAGPAAAVATDDGGALRGLRLADGTVVDAAAVAVSTRMMARLGPFADLGVAVVDAPMGMGQQVDADARGATSVPGVFAVGNVRDVSQQVLQAAADGARVGGMINAELAAEDADLAVAADDAAYWDRRYAESDKWWSGNPNGALVDEAAELEPGRALDVGCGEGADAVWLAERGWTVTASDVSSVAVDRARAAGRDAGVDVDWVVGDLFTAPPPAGSFDLVSVQYPALRKTAGNEAVEALLAAVAPGGTLLIVGHDFDAVDHHHHGGDWDPSAEVQPPDVAAVLAERGGWTITVDESRPRRRIGGGDGDGPRGPAVPDRVLRAVRHP